MNTSRVPYFPRCAFVGTICGRRIRRSVLRGAFSFWPENNPARAPRGEIRLPVACPKTPVHDAHTKTNNGRVGRAFVRGPKARGGPRGRETPKTDFRAGPPPRNSGARQASDRKRVPRENVYRFLRFFSFNIGHTRAIVVWLVGSGRFWETVLGPMRFKIRLLNYFAVIWLFSSHLNVRSAITKSITIATHDCRILSFRTVPTRKSFLKITPTRAINT